MKKTNSKMVPTVLVAAMLMATGPALGGANGGASSAVTAKATVTGPGAFTSIALFTDPCAGVSGSLNATVTGTTNDGGGNDIVWFTIYDDSVEKFAQQISVPVGTTTTTPIAVSYPGTVGGSAPGIALLLGETRGAGNLISIDPYFPTPTGSACSGGIGGPVPTPTLSEWSMISLAALVGLFGFGALMRRRQD